MSLPLSICIPTYNRALLLERTLRHLAECSHVFSEVVISDNASTDRTRDIVEAWRPRFARFRYARQAHNVGPFRNIYAAQSLAAEKYAFVLSDDDAVIPSAVADAVALLEAEPDCVAVYGGYERCDAELGVTTYVQLPPFPGRYARADKMSLIRNANVLGFAVLRSAVVQRHCFLDNTTHGLLRMIAQLLDHGTIQVVGYPIYRHAETTGRLEDHVMEPEYHDNLRSDWELFAASIDGVDLRTTTMLVVNYTLPVYLFAYGAATNQNMPLFERTFLLRYLASLGNANAEAAARRDIWERNRLIAAMIELLKDRVAVAGVTRLIVERGDMNLPKMLEGLRAGAPERALIEVTAEALRGFAAEPGDFLVAEYWRTLDARTGEPASAAGQIAVADLIASLRLPGSSRERVLFGPSGSLHVVDEARQLPV